MITTTTKNWKYLLIALVLSIFILPIVNAQVNLKALPMQDCQKGSVQCGYSNEGTSAIKECRDGYEWSIKEDCGKYGVCTFDNEGNPICKISEDKVESFQSENNLGNALIIGVAIIIGLIIFAIILSRKNKK